MAKAIRQRIGEEGQEGVCKCKKAMCWGAASLLVAIRTELCLVCGLGAAIWEDYQRCRSQTILVELSN